MKRFDSPVMTTQDAADYLRINRSTLYRMLKHGVLPFFRIGGDWRIRRVDLDEWMKQQVEKSLHTLH